MPSRPCLRCGRLSPLGVDCPSCGSSRQTRGRGSGWHASAFRAAVLKRAGYRCEHGRGAGDRCTATTDLEAHHRVDLVAGGSNDPKRNGIALCRVQREALVRAVSVAVGHAVLIDGEETFGTDDFTPAQVTLVRGAGLGPRIDAELAGLNLLARSGCALPDPLPVRSGVLLAGDLPLM